MPSSREIKARQQRQRAKIAELHIERDRKHRRRRWLYGVGGFLVFVAVVGGIYAIGKANEGEGNPNAAPPPKKCVAQQGELPKGAPKVDVVVGNEPTKLIVKDLKEGTGAVVKKDDTVTAQYIGVACTTGKIFDSSYSRGTEPAVFPLPDVIKGWQQGIPGMKVGGRRLLGVPAKDAYGSRPQQGSGIGIDEPLWFVVDVTATQPKDAPTTTAPPATAPPTTVAGATTPATTTPPTTAAP